MFFGYRVEHARKFGLPRAGVSTPPPLVSPVGLSPSSGGGIELPRHSSGDGYRVELRRFFITFSACSVAPFSMPPPTSGAVGGRGGDLRAVRRAGTPAPPAVRSGGPRPFSRPPLPTVAPRQGRRGYGRAVSAYGGRFCRLPRQGAAPAAGGRLTRPPRPRRRGAPCSLRSRCAPSPPRPPRRSRRGLGVRYATRQPPLVAPRRRFRPLPRARCPFVDFGGLPKKPLSLRHPRSRPPRGSFFLGTLPSKSIHGI